MATTKVSIKQHRKEKTSRVIYLKKKLTVSEKKELSIKTFIKLTIESKGKCYMLSFNPTDGRSCRINDIIAELIKNGYMTDMLPTLKYSILFLSSYNLSPINKFIHNNFPNLKFVLVRLNRKSFPALKYCY